MGLFGRKKDSSANAAPSGDPRFISLRELALADEDLAVFQLLKQMEADGVPEFGPAALDVAVTLWAVDENSYAAAAILNFLPDMVKNDRALYIDACYHAGLAYSDINMEDEALDFWRIAADLGSDKAQFMVAMTVEVEDPDFLTYLEAAAAQGHERAIEFIAENPDIIADARSRSGSIAPGGLSSGAGALTNHAGGGLTKSSGMGGLGSGPDSTRAVSTDTGAGAAGTKQFCTSCGTQLAAGAKFCGGCGTPA